jgi:hypothetical protein
MKQISLNRRQLVLLHFSERFKGEETGYSETFAVSNYFMIRIFRRGGGKLLPYLPFLRPTSEERECKLYWNIC